MPTDLSQVSFMLTKAQRDSLTLAAVLDAESENRQDWVNNAFKQAAERLCERDEFASFKDRLVSVWP